MFKNLTAILVLVAIVFYFLDMSEDDVASDSMVGISDSSEVDFVTMDQVAEKNIMADDSVRLDSQDISQNDFSNKIKSLLQGFKSDLKNTEKEINDDELITRKYEVYHIINTISKKGDISSYVLPVTSNELPEGLQLPDDVRLDKDAVITVYNNNISSFVEFINDSCLDNSKRSKATHLNGQLVVVGTLSDHKSVEWYLECLNSTRYEHQRFKGKYPSCN